jgi:hypothetical protein
MKFFTESTLACMGADALRFECMPSAISKAKRAKPKARQGKGPPMPGGDQIRRDGEIYDKVIFRIIVANEFQEFAANED